MKEEQYKLTEYLKSLIDAGRVSGNISGETLVLEVLRDYKVITEYVSKKQDKIPPNA